MVSMMRISRILQPLFRGIAVTLVLGCLSLAQVATAQAAAVAQVEILSPKDVTALMPHSVFFRGQTASVQLRNTYGLRLADGTMVLAGLVDNSGYATGIQQKYQGYLLSEIGLAIGGKKLPAGAYGFGFVANETFIVMDLGAHQVLKVTSKADPSLARPRPLTIVAGGEPGSYRLYEGRRYVSVQLK